MASIERRKRKDGTISYHITVSARYTSDGTKVRHKTVFVPEPGMSERQAEKAAQKEAMLFEQKYESGYELDNNQSFAEYTEYVLAMKMRNGMKRSTYEGYITLLPRINAAIGTMRLRDIRPMHLNNFYATLSKPGIRSDNRKAMPITDINKVVLLSGIKKAALARSCKMSASTVSAVCRGDSILESYAKSLAKALSVPYSSLFKTVQDSAPLSSKTIIEYHHLIASILHQAEREMLVPYNAASKASPPKLRRKEVNYFQPDEVCAILDTLENEPLKWQVITHLLIITGARRGEIAGLKWSRIDKEHSRLKIDSALLYSPKIGIYDTSTKTGNTRYIPIPEQTIAMLDKQRAAQDWLQEANGDRWFESDYVFTRDDGRPIDPDTITAWLGDFSRRHNLPHINPHAFRHSAASILIARGTDVVTVSKMLGHADVTTTENIYAHVIEESKVAAGNLLAESYFGGR